MSSHVVIDVLLMIEFNFFPFQAGAGANFYSMWKMDSCNKNSFKMLMYLHIAIAVCNVVSFLTGSIRIGRHDVVCSVMVSTSIYN